MGASTAWQVTELDSGQRRAYNCLLNCAVQIVQSPGFSLPFLCDALSLEPLIKRGLIRVS
jgi:hypothetical protein